MSASFRSCASCNAPVAYDPASRSLACAYCDARRGINAATGVPEHPLDTAPWNPPSLPSGVVSARCTGCGAEAELASATIATTCAYCLSPLEVKADAAVQPAEGVAPFLVDRKRAESAFSKWLGTLWFRPNDLKKLARLHELRGRYIPAWIFAAHAQSSWTAEAGYHYWETETVEVNGRQETRQVQKTRWERVRGHRSDDWDAVVVSASQGLPAEELLRVDPFDPNELRVFDGDFLAGFEAERHGSSVKEAWPTAKRRIEQEQESRCARDVPGDTHRFLRVETRLDDERYRNALLPLWIGAYRYREKVFRVLVNGQTGLAAGDAPWSIPKIVAFVVFLVALLAVLWVFLQR